jgi:hypothetical protein
MTKAKISAEARAAHQTGLDERAERQWRYRRIDEIVRDWRRRVNPKKSSRLLWLAGDYPREAVPPELFEHLEALGDIFIWHELARATPIGPEKKAESGPIVAPESAPPRPHALTTRELAQAFAGIERGEDAWRRLLADAANARWAEPARAGKGERGRALWNPLEFARCLMRRDAKPETLSRAFRQKELLAPWREEWAAVISVFSDYGLDDRQR